MEAIKLKTIVDLEEAWLKDERYELINGEIIKRPMPKAEHGLAQGRTYSKLESFDKEASSSGWWFMTEISVRYNENQCPVHDIAGWRKERVHQRPIGVMEIMPDWVCEIVSPGHESKDTVRNFNTLMRYNVPYYWIIWPEDEALIAYKLVDGKYLAIESIEGGGKVRVEPFKGVDFDLDYIFGKD
jgi:Uma2 family endonuclease